MPAKAETALIDGRGLSFADCRDSLPKLARDFPVPYRPFDITLRRKWRERRQCCQLCGEDFQRGEWQQVHHIMGGSAGRSDEPTNLFCVHARCHDAIHLGSVTLAEVLWAKWSTDQENTDWKRLAILKGEFLPEPRKAETGDR